MEHIVKYEWLYRDDVGDWRIIEYLYTEQEVAFHYSEYEYKKTGREFLVPTNKGE